MNEFHDEVLGRLANTFQAYGYEGTSLAKISEATGLIKASLYYRFPGGKEEMAEAALAAVDRRFAEYILLPLEEPGEPAVRLRKVSRRLRAFYADGRRACLLNTLTLAGSPPPVLAHARQTLEFWVGKFAQVAAECGAGPEAARVAAQDAVGALEGALVLSRVTGSTAPFRRTIRSLDERLGVAR